MDGSTLWLIIAIFAALAIFGFAQLAVSKHKKQDLRRLVDNQKGFNSSHFLVKVPLSTTTPVGLAVDDSAQKICLIVGNNLRVIGYGDLIESEVVVDGHSVTKTSRASQFIGTAVGAVLAGGVGAIIGGLSGTKSTKEKINGVSLKLIVNDTKNPIHLIDFFEMTSTGSTVPKIALDEAKYWHDLLSVIIRQARDDAPAVKGSMLEDIERYAALHKEGMLSDEEFAAAKRKVLGDTD